MNWDTAGVTLSDSASPYEVLTFLDTCASQLMHLQLQHTAEQEKLTELVENVRFRCTFTSPNFNKYNRSLCDDPRPRPYDGDANVACAICIDDMRAGEPSPTRCMPRATLAAPGTRPAWRQRLSFFMFVIVLRLC